MAGQRLGSQGIRVAEAIGLVRTADQVGGRHADKSPRLVANDPVAEFLLSPNPLNCVAQVLFYEKSDVKKNKELRATLERQFVTYSSAAMARFLDIAAENLPAASAAPASPIQPGRAVGGGGLVRPRVGGGMKPGGGVAPSPVVAPPSAPGEPLKASDADLGPQIAQQLWTGEFRKFIESQVGELHALDKLPSLRRRPRPFRKIPPARWWLSC